MREGEEIMANRLTEKDEQGNWCLKGVPWVDLTPGATISQETYEKLYGALWKLKDYEDTGLNPEEVCRLRERDIPKKVEIKEWSPSVCPCCGGKLSESIGDGYYKHPTFLERCPNIDCGQRLDWSE